MKTHFFFFVSFLFALLGPATAVDFVSIRNARLGFFDSTASSTFEQARTIELDNFHIQGHMYFRIPDENGDVRTYLASTTTMRNVPLDNAVAPYSVTAVDISSYKEVIILTITTPESVEEDKIVNQKLGRLLTSRSLATSSGNSEVLVLKTVTGAVVKWRLKIMCKHGRFIREKFERWLSTLATQFVAPLLHDGISFRTVRLEDIANDFNPASDTFHLRYPGAAKLIKDGESLGESLIYAANSWFYGIFLSATHPVLANLVTPGSEQRNILFDEFCAKVWTEVEYLKLKDDIERARRMLGDSVEVETAVETRDDNPRHVERMWDDLNLMEEEKDIHNSQ